MFLVSLCFVIYLNRYDPATDCLVPSVFIIESHKIGTLGALMIWILKTLRLVQYRKVNEQTFECSNLTIINLVLVIFGPLKEKRLVMILYGLQLLGTVLAFGIRYGLSQLFY